MEEQATAVMVLYITTPVIVVAASSLYASNTTVCTGIGPYYTTNPGSMPTGTLYVLNGSTCSSYTGLIIPPYHQMF